MICCLRQHERIEAAGITQQLFGRREPFVQGVDRRTIPHSFRVSLLERTLRLKQKWAWLLAFGQTIAWAIRFWGDHAAAFDRETVMITALVGVVVSAAIGWLCSLLD